MKNFHIFIDGRIDPQGDGDYWRRVTEILINNNGATGVMWGGPDMKSLDQLLSSSPVISGKVIIVCRSYNPPSLFGEIGLRDLELHLIGPTNFSIDLTPLAPLLRGSKHRLFINGVLVHQHDMFWNDSRNQSLQNRLGLDGFVGKPTKFLENVPLLSLILTKITLKTLGRADHELAAWLETLASSFQSTRRRCLEIMIKDNTKIQTAQPLLDRLLGCDDVGYSIQSINQIVALMRRAALSTRTTLAEIIESTNILGGETVRPDLEMEDLAVIASVPDLEMEDVDLQPPPATKYFFTCPISFEEDVPCLLISSKLEHSNVDVLSLLSTSSMDHQNFSSKIQAMAQAAKRLDYVMGKSSFEVMSLNRDQPSEKKIFSSPTTRRPIEGALSLDTSETSLRSLKNLLNSLFPTSRIKSETSIKNQLAALYVICLSSEYLDEFSEMFRCFLEQNLEEVVSGLCVKEVRPKKMAGRDGKDGPIGHRGQRGPRGCAGKDGCDGKDGPIGHRGQRGPRGCVV